MAKTKTDGGPMNKYQAVCATLRDGVTRPADGVVHAKERYGVEMTSNQFSAHKTRAVIEKVIPAEPAAEAAKQTEAAEPKAVQQDTPKPKPPAPAAPKAEAKLAAPMPPAPKPPKPEAKSPPKAEPEAAPKPAVKAPAAASPADLARQVKQLVEKYGAGAVRDMTGVFEG